MDEKEISNIGRENDIGWKSKLHNAFREGNIAYEREETQEVLRLAKMENEVDGEERLYKDKLVHDEYIRRMVEELGPCARLEDMDGREKDSAYIKGLEKIAEGWIKAIREITNEIENYTTKNTAKEEIEHWKRAKEAVDSIERELESAEARLTLEVLSAAGKHRHKIAITIDTNLGRYKELVSRFDNILKRIRLEDIYNVDTLREIRKIVIGINKVLEYRVEKETIPIERIGSIYEKITDLVVGRIVDIVKRENIMGLE